MEDKENLAPLPSRNALQKRSSSASPQKTTSRKGRSKSIGPGGLDDGEAEGAKQQERQDAKNRRKSTYVPATKSILTSEQEKKERQAARRKTLANRRVSFAPEATLHTWDVIEFMRDPTTSTDSSGSTTRRGSGITRSSNGGSPFKHSSQEDSDPPSTPPEQEDEPGRIPASPAPQRNLHQKKRRRSSGASVGSEDGSSPSGVSGSSDVESEEEDESAVLSDDDATATGMSMDLDEGTLQSMGGQSDSSTGSSARLEAALRQAAHTAGTRGILYDEYGDASMELAGDEVTTAFKPWAGQINEQIGSASFDQENVNPFSPAFKAQLVSGRVSRPSTVHEEDTGDLSMDVTKAVGGIVNRAPVQQPESSPMEDGTMDFTQAVGKIHAPTTQTAQKRRRSTADTGSPGVTAPLNQSKRRRSSLARSSMGDDTMDLTMAVGGIQTTGSPAKPERRRGPARRRSSGVASQADDATMDFTQAVGTIKQSAKPDQTTSSLDSNEELTMELTTVIGGIKEAVHADAERPVTPQQAQSPIRDAVNTTPKDQERFVDPPDSGPKKLLTPIFQKQLLQTVEEDAKLPASVSPGRRFRTAEKQASAGSSSPARRTRSALANATHPDVVQDTPTAEERRISTTPTSSPPKAALPSRGPSPLRTTPIKSPARQRSSATPDSTLRLQLDEQLQAPEPSPTAQKQLRSTPAKSPSTPAEPAVTPRKSTDTTQDGRRLAESIKLLSTPRKETLKGLTPRKQNAPQQSEPPKANTPRRRSPSKEELTSPVKQLHEDLKRIQESGEQGEIRLQNFLDLAGIRFMDLTATKRRMTTAMTPSKARKAAEGSASEEEETHETSLESAIIAGACTVPQLDMYQHACRELKRYISDGKTVVKDLEKQTAESTPPLLLAYMAATPARRKVLDAQMREMKAQARLRSKEVWYQWRGQLMDDLMGPLQGVAEGLIRDDEVLGRKAEVLEQVVPELAKQYVALKDEAARLEAEKEEVSEEKRLELEGARGRLVDVGGTLEERRGLLEDLRREMAESEAQITDLEETKAEFAAAVAEAERVKEACRSISTKEIADLRASVQALEQEYGWSIVSAASSPTTITMAYRGELKLFFHPLAFPSTKNSFKPGIARPNAPISLHYTGSNLTTTLRFFLQLLQSSLHALPQCQTSISDLLALVSSRWDTAAQIAEAERRLNLETLTEARIVSDERLQVRADVLLPKVRTKIRACFDIDASIVELGRDDAEGGHSNGLEFTTSVLPTVQVVYGEQFNEKKMTDFIAKEVKGRFEGWDRAVRALRERLVAQGMKR